MKKVPISTVLLVSTLRAGDFEIYFAKFGLYEPTAVVLESTSKGMKIQSST
jgi:hypothetical protein